MQQSEDLEQRTEEPTPKRQEQFRADGSIAHSRDLTALGALLCAIIFMSYFFNSGFYHISQYTKQLLSLPSNIIYASLDSTLFNVTYTLLSHTLLPISAFALAATMIIGMAQIGLPMSLKPLSPSLKRLNPQARIGNLVNPIKWSKDSLKHLSKIALMLIIVAWSIGRDWRMLLDLNRYDLSSGLSITFAFIYRIVLRVACAMVVFGAFDFISTKRTLMMRMRMTKQELKDELKEEHGNPFVKGKIRSMQKLIAKQRMLKDVETADVVVVNPTEYAVALKYMPHKRSAPKVVAKGVDTLAAKIRQVAREKSVPIIENKPLARALYAQVKVGRDIPQELYQSVAQVLAYVYRIRGRRSA